MLLISDELIRVDVPDDSGQWVEYVQPDRALIKKARKAKLNEGRDDMRALGSEMSVALMESAKRSEKEEDDDKQGEESDPFDISAFDIDTLLVACVKGWSLDTRITPKTLQRLTESSAMWLGQEIVNSVRPPSKEELKNSAVVSSTP